MSLSPLFRKSFLIAAFVLGLSALSVTSFAACVPRPGCSCDVWQAQANHADANRVRDKGYARQIIKQNDNTLGMTCFDHTLALSSRLGQIFSDKLPGGVMAPANIKAFGMAVYDASGGVGQNDATGKSKTLGSSYSYVMNDELKKHADDFTDSLSAFLGATALGFLDTFTAAIDAIASQITGVIATINSYFDQLDSAMDTIEDILDLMGAALPAAVPLFVSTVETYWDMISGAITSAVSSLQSTVSGFVDQIKNQVMGALGSLLGNFDLPGTGECSRVQQLWNPASGGGPIGSIGTLLAAAGAVTGFRPITGGGIEHGTPYFNFSDLVKKTVSGGGTDLMKEINNSSNNAVLSAALADIQSGGVLANFKAPGSGVFWTQPETLPLSMSVTDIINKM